ncbi:MAG: hypothetical protein OEZ06_12255 [Myxococcales bacterium]|nr:hypothetical protein [Myxococcales bacterium]
MDSRDRNAPVAGNGSLPIDPVITDTPPLGGTGGSGGGIALAEPDGQSGGRVSIGSTPLPCEVDDVLATSCRGCHGADPGLQAPMALLTYEDLMADSVQNPGTPVYQLVGQRVHSETAPMPPINGGRALLETEMSALDAWLSGGRPAGLQDCGNGPTTGVPIEQPENTIGSITYEPPSDAEIDQCYQFYAHQNPVPGDTTPFQARSGEYYSAFWWEVPWEGEKQGLIFRFNDTPITHHLLLYDTTEPATDGAVNGNTTGSHPGAPDLLAAWAVNQQREQFMPKEVGMALPVRGSGRRFLVEVHYFNPGGMVPDNSGIEVCTGKELRPNTATVSWLGSEAITLLPGAPLDLTGTCTPQTSQDIYIFRSFPHMHEQGVSLDSYIKRLDGSMELLIDKPFDFNNQLMYDTPAVLHPGEQVLTTCHFQNKSDRLIGVGYDSLSEMCFNFVYAWPAKTLLGGVSLTGTSTPCLL